MSEKRKGNWASKLIIIVACLAICGFIGYKIYESVSMLHTEETEDQWEIVYSGKTGDSYDEDAAIKALSEAYSKAGIKGYVNPFKGFGSRSSATKKYEFVPYNIVQIRANKTMKIIEVKFQSVEDADKYIIYRQGPSSRFDCSGDPREASEPLTLPNVSLTGLPTTLMYTDNQGIIRKIVWNWEEYSYSMVVSDAIESTDLTGMNGWYNCVLEALTYDYNGYDETANWYLF